MKFVTESNAAENHDAPVTPDTKEQFSEFVTEEAITVGNNMDPDETIGDKPKEVDEQINPSSEVDLNIISTDCASVPIPTQNTEELGEDSVDAKCNDSLDAKSDDSAVGKHDDSVCGKHDDSVVAKRDDSVDANESSVLSNMNSTNLENPIVSNMDSIGAEEYVVANADFIGAEEHIESNIDSTEESAIDSKHDTDVISLVTVTVETSDDRINKAEAESAVTALFITNIQSDKDKQITTKERHKSETNYDSDASDATVRYSDDEDHHSLKIDIPMEDDESVKNPTETSNEETIDTVDTVSSITPQNIPVDTTIMDVCENESCQTAAPTPLLESTAATVDPQQTVGKRKTRVTNSVTVKKTTKPETVKTPALRQKRKYVRKADNVTKKSRTAKTTEEKLTLTISRSPRKNLKESLDTDSIDHPGDSVCTNDNDNRKATRSKQSVNGRNVPRRMHSRRSRLTVTKKRKPGKKDGLLDFPDIKKIIEGGADQSVIDEDELPTILPPKRRRVNSKGTLKSKITVSDMDRLVQEFPRHNWLENKYKKEEDVSDNQDKGAMLEPNGDSPQGLGNDTKPDVDTIDMEVSTTTAVDENIDNECSNSLREDTVTSETISETKAGKDVVSPNDDTPLNLCVKLSPGQREQLPRGIPLMPKETSDPHPIKAIDSSEPTDLSCKANVDDHLNGSDVKHLQGNIGMVNLSCTTSSTTTTESSGHTNDIYSPVNISNTTGISSKINSGSAFQVTNTVSSTSPAVHSSQERGVPKTFTSNEVMENHPNKINVSNACVTQNMSPKSKELDKEVYKHLREYRLIQEREARMAQERAELIRLKNEKANLLRQLGIQRKPRNLNGSNLGIRPINGDPNQIFALDLANTSHGTLSREKQSKCQAELLGKINNALRYRKRLGHPSRLTQLRPTGQAGNPAPAHMSVGENIVGLSQEIEKCKVQKPAHMDITGPFMKRKDPLTRPPFEFSTSQPSKSVPPLAHSQTPFQSAGQLIYPLPSFLEHKTKLSRKLQSNISKEGSASTNTTTSVSSPCVKGTDLSEAKNKQNISPEVSLKGNVQCERQQEIKPVSCPQNVSTLIDQTATNTVTTSSCTSVQIQETQQSQAVDKHQDTEMVVQRELTEALAKRQKFDDPEISTQKSKTDQSHIPNSYSIDPKLFQSIQENAQEKIKEAERKQQRYTQRVNQQQTRQQMLKMQHNSQQMQKDLIVREQQHKQMMMQKQQQQYIQQQQQPPQQFKRQVQQHIQQQQKLQRQQQALQQQKQLQQKQHPQPQENVMQQVQHHNKTQVIPQTVQPIVSQGIFPATHMNINSSQGQIHPQVVSSGQSRFMTPYSGQNVNPMIQTQLANRLRVPVNITSQSSNNITVPSGQSRESGSQDQLLVLQRPHAAVTTMPQSNTVDQSQRVLVGARTVSRGSGVSGFNINVNDTSNKDHRPHRPSVPEATDSDIHFPISFHPAGSHGQVVVQTTAVNSRYPVVTAHQNRNTHVHVEIPSSNTPLQQSYVTQHQQQQPNARPEVVARVPSTVQAALQNNPTNTQSNNTGKIMNYGQIHTSTTVQQSPRYTRDLPTTPAYSSGVVVQRETPPQLQQINGNCKVCGKSAMFLCSSCKLVWYCSQTCQLNHWVSHSHECKS
ncbi:formin-J-like [Pecten maximus]|uniref:formin-J-like n=1 Tax=Pecten maximus TaxID=6579 RepID=UPI0014587CE1|nr:formin-J-like [Pecten maximus]